ncbi:tRNA lysidine(34) synthetase TilS [Pseudonocardiaceae bacterium YIM PH 21723]|nr:tRNA lysidine(34) synthetase TilS [Pseudonocardiaceae bacterium YIM PH 21723]
MSAPDPAVSLTRNAVSRFLKADETWSHLKGHIAVACSGGADSLALAAATIHHARKVGLTVHGLVVDHGLQKDSAETAHKAADQLHQLGAQPQVISVTVGTQGGPEAAARTARYQALRANLPAGALCLLGHTQDDQAETVLLGLGRGSGPRSIAGMRPLTPPWGRPFLEVTRRATEAACAALGLTPWQDPHNSDPAFTRVRVRTEVMPLLEDVLQQGVAAALARTAAQLQEDADALDDLAVWILQGAVEGATLSVEAVTGAHPAVRRRVLRAWLHRAGVSSLTDLHLRGVDALVGDWRGQGPVALPGGLDVARTHGRLHVTTKQ